MSKFCVTNFDGLGDALCRASGVDPRYVRRLVLDLPVGEPAKLYLELFADDEILGVDLAATGVEITEAANGG